MGLGGAVTADRFRGGRDRNRLRTVENPGYRKYGRAFRTASGEMATLNPRRIAPGQYQPSFTPFGARGGAGGRAGGGGVATGRWGAVGGYTGPRGQFETGGRAPGRGPGPGPGGRGGWTGQAVPELQIEAQPDPRMVEAQRRWEEQADWMRQQAETTDANLQEQINLYRQRMGEGPTTRAIERASSAIRDFAAGQAAEAQQAAAMGGRAAGFGAVGLGESAQAAQARAAADISLGREAQLDRLLATGTQIMGAPAAQRLAYAGLGAQHFGTAPYAPAAQMDLAQRQFGLEAWRVPRQLGIEEMGAQAAAYGSPIQWAQMLGLA